MSATAHDQPGVVSCATASSMQPTTPPSCYCQPRLIQAIRQQDWQLVGKLQAMQRACWNRSLSAELSGLILGKTSRYNVKMLVVSCPLLRDTANAAEPITPGGLSARAGG